MSNSSTKKPIISAIFLDQKLPGIPKKPQGVEDLHASVKGVNPSLNPDWNDIRKNINWNGNTGFKNAKPRAMLEEGLVIKPPDELKAGDKGVLDRHDLNRVEVEVLNVKKVPITDPDRRPGLFYREYTFLSIPTKETFVIDDQYHYKDSKDWSFYTHTEPKKFVPRKGGSKRRKTMKKKRSSMRFSRKKLYAY